MSTGIGDILQEARLARGEDLTEVAEALKIRRSHIVALETENFESLGAATYARGHLRNYARHLGLDPEPLLAAYDAAHRGDEPVVADLTETTSMASATPRAEVPRWLLMVGVVALVLVALAIIGTLGNRTPEVANQPDEPTATATTSATGPATTDDTATGTGDESPADGTATATTSGSPSPSESPSPSPSPAVDGVELFLAFEQDSWMEIAIDGAPHPRSQTIIEEGETMELSGEELIEIRFGNAGGVDVELNGERLGRPGSNGEVVDVTYTPEGAQEEA